MTRLATALAALAALCLLAGCGGDAKTIPNDDGASLIRALRDARNLAGDPDKCPQLQTAVQRVQARVAALPASVDKDTRDSLVNGVNNLIDDARSECAGVETTPTETTPPRTTPTTPTAPTQTTPTTGNGGVTPGNPPEVPPGQGKKGEKKKGDER
jgi:outer membrane murein-binding lipoprotein Lpp